MDEQESMSMDEKPSSITSLREYLVDILGCFIPGILFLGSLFILLVLPSSIFLFNLQENNVMSSNGYGFLSNLFKFNKAEIIVYCLIASYAIGRIFFRLDQMRVDKKSYDTILKNPKGMELRRPWVVNEQAPEAEKRGGSDDKVHYPYYYIYEYLDHRGLGHLCKFISWRGANEPSYQNRTTNIINILKSRINFYYPNKFPHIYKNEAHIRLMSSVWYVMYSILAVSIVSFSLNVFFILLLYFNKHIAPADPFLKSQQIYISIFPLLLSLSSLFFTFLAKKTFRNFFILCALEKLCKSLKVHLLFLGFINAFSRIFLRSKKPKADSGLPTLTISITSGLAAIIIRDTLWLP